MARRQKQHAHENHERWLVSYADFITLLFAFFVVMFASSHADKKKAKEMSASVKEAFEQGSMPKALANLMGRKRPPETDDPKRSGQPAEKDTGKTDPALAALAELVPSLESLTKSLANEIADGKVAINMEPRGLVVSLKEAAFFPPAGDAVQAEAFPILGKIAESARTLPNQMLLEGHTDSTPIHNDRFRSNWDLSAARAIAMLNVFSERYGIERTRMSVSGYAENVPVAGNETVEGRRKNRRVDVVFLNQYGLKTQPGRQ
ncbi:flagellar motor protein MotB [Bryobacter aggregatus]|uniref:flagellar motor protein MotB n=1 Tax=Bryobacter aggregatus TaxID=360054 RepID=UPI0004E19FF3|nr:flagellar motor protein MotB [Bryobacter aggregatus]